MHDSLMTGSPGKSAQASILFNSVIGGTAASSQSPNRETAPSRRNKSFLLNVKDTRINSRQVGKAHAMTSSVIVQDAPKASLQLTDFLNGSLITDGAGTA